MRHEGRLRTAPAAVGHTMGHTNTSRAVGPMAATTSNGLRSWGRTKSSDDRRILRAGTLEIGPGGRLAGAKSKEQTSSDDCVTRLLEQAASAHESLQQSLREEISELRSRLKAKTTQSELPLRRTASINHEAAQDDERTVPREGKLLQPRCKVVAVSQLCGSGNDVHVTHGGDTSSRGLDVAHGASGGDDSNEGISLISATQASAGELPEADVTPGDGRQSQASAGELPEVAAAIALMCLDMSFDSPLGEGGVDRLSTGGSSAGSRRASMWQACALRSVWVEAQQSLTGRELSHNKSKSARMKERATMGSSQGSEAVDVPWRCVIVHPGSMRKFIWDSMAMVAMMFDIITLPLILAFNAFGDDRTFACMVWFTRVFWSVDILASFLTGYYTRDEQRVVMEPLMIAANYAKTWMVFDVGIVCIDWIIFASVTDNTKTYARATRMNRVFRGLRLLRILRFLKVLKYKRFIVDIISSEYLYANLNVLRLLSVIIIVSHLIACFWFAIGSEEETGWVHKHVWAQDSTEYAYTTAYHWAVMHLGVGEVEIEPQTTMERCFSIGVVLCGIIFFSCLVSSATNSMSQLQTNQAEHRRQHALFRRFCRQNKVPRDLFARIMRFLKYEMMELHKQRIDHHDIGLLDSLSGPLYTELLYCMYSPILQKHSVFHMLCRTWPQIAQKISSQVVSSKYLATSDMLFDRGEEADNVFWVMSGQMEYLRESWPSWIVEEENWISEPALWTMWLYQGSLQAIGPCRLLVIDVVQFVEVVLTAPGTWRDITSYAQSFVDYLNSYAFDFCFDVTHDHSFEGFMRAKRSRLKFDRLSA